MEEKTRDQIFGRKGEEASCNLCNENKRMSQAHVPPQACIKSNNRKRDTYLYFNGDKKYILQNGIHFYTLCEKCNNSIGNFDTELASFTTKIREKINSFSYIPQYAWVFECKPNLIARSLIGAFLTASRDCINTSHSDLQKYVRNNDCILPNGLKIGFWLHPFDSVIVKPEFIMLNPKPQKVFFIMKYFPIAWIIFKEDMNEHPFFDHYGIHNFSQHLSDDHNSTSKISIHPMKEKDEHWPSPDDVSGILIGKNSQNNALLGIN